MSTKTTAKSSRKTPATKAGPDRRRSAANRSAGHQSSRWLVRLVIALIAVAALAAVVATSLGGGSTTTSEDTAFDQANATVDGTALAPLPRGGADPAVGQRAPVVEGRTRDGSTLRAPATGRPTVLLFLAHWCPHCQREVPAIQDWADSGQLPDDVDLVAVSTAVDPARPNYPASAWLDRENWSSPTIADAQGTAAAAYGLTGFPFWVAIDADGTVVERRSGELSLDQVRVLATAAT